MKLEKVKLLRIFTSEEEKIEGETAYKFLIELAREEGLSGATAFKGVLGFGKSRKLRKEGIIFFKSKLPIVVEIIDTEEKIFKFLNTLKNYISDDCCLLITLEDIEVYNF